jgi:hypothetical protein
MKYPKSALRVMLSLTLVMSLSGSPISAQTAPAGEPHARQNVPSSKLAAAPETRSAANQPAPLHQTEAAATGPNLTIDAGSGRHAISPYIYGINYNQNLIPDVNPSIIRWGGDATSQYNWQKGVTNAGSDYYFSNGNQSPTFEQFLATDQAAGVQTIGTIPINGWVATSSSGCGFSIAKYGAQKQANGDCGNGVLLDGNPVTQEKITDPGDADTSVQPSFMQLWVSTVAGKYGSTANGGVTYWELDNEPVWWPNVHQNIHPILPDQTGYTTYQEVWNKGLEYAQAIKAGDPTAKVAGPITSGYGDLFFSRLDFQNGWSTAPYVYYDNPVDRMANGNQDFVAWYLQQFAANQQKTGQRLLDYLDVHGYMPGTGGDATDPASDAVRLQSTRVFWDPNYVVANKSGTLFSADNATHSAQTGNWVSNGTTFALVDATSGVLLATTTVALQGSTTITPSSISYSSGASITASPNPIPANEFFVGQATISWSAPSSTNVQVFVGDGEYLSNECVCLIPRMKNWVNGNYPGTKLAITEYNLGAQTDLNGALAVADLLGVFGREGLDVATMWPSVYPNLSTTDAVTYAFRLYRNYDGAKSTFGETGVSAVSADQSLLSVYAAQRSSDSVLTVMVVNKTGNDLTSSLSLANFSPASSAKVFSYSAANLTAIQPQPSQTVTPTGFTATFPANSATLFVIAQAEVSPATITASPNPITVAAGATAGQTTISWSAAGSSAVEVHVGSATGTLFTTGGSTGSAQTGNWVGNGMQFFLVDATTHQTLATTTVTLTTGGTATITANPNPITVPAGATVGQTTISWNAPSSSAVEVHINTATGTLFSGGGPTGSAQTGNWVSNGMTFVLVDATTHQPLASTSVTFAGSGEPATITADPNPIPVASGSTVGQTTVSWNAPGISAVEVHIATASGTLFAGGGTTGSSPTGLWVSDGMVFVLVNAATHLEIARVTVTVGAGGTPTITANPNPITVAPGANVGQTTISWNAPGHAEVEVHVGTPTGNLFAAGASTGSSPTGDWVSNGMAFVLVDASTHMQLATTTVNLTGS